MLAGKTPFGYRFLHVVAGLLTIVVIFRIANDWFGAAAATWAATLLVFNEYH
jgi:dolichyl-phosphate-mannose--protein O-mannosyl transferase